ncbi:MAG TPA: multicopper oxidase domain-containing protein [Symbiobacteriaceae bacterium]|nr:multicopper oxidase domain-containing protein [Symbiobacteriaceae bacterium]
MAVDLWAAAGALTLPGTAGPVSVPAWGYTFTEGSFRVPGPVLTATEGTVLEVNLHNGLSRAVSLMVPALAYNPGPAPDFSTFAAAAAPGGTAAYALPASRPGTFLYESGTRPEEQVLMGLYGALVIRPADWDPVANRTAYGAGTGSAFDQEHVVLLGEADTVMQAGLGAGIPQDQLTYRPDWWLINGRPFPATLDPDDGSGQPMGARVAATAGSRVLLRCLNAGFATHLLHFGGLVGQVIGEDGYPLGAAAHEVRTLLLPPGGTADVVVTPAAPGEYLIMDRDLKHVVNEGQFPGGMMTRLDVTLP